MKRFVLGFFVFAFVFNTLSLSVYASSCPREMGFENGQTKAAAMSCHENSEKSAETSEKSPKTGHCKGLCFCQHASLGQNIVPLRFAAPLEGLALVKSLAFPARVQDYRSTTLFPLERPPKHFS